MAVNRISSIFIIPPTCRERFLPLAGARGQPLRQLGMTLAGISDLHAGYEIARPAPGNHTLLLTLAGEGRYESPVAGGRMRPGELWVGPAGMPHHYWAGKTWRIAWCHLADLDAWGSLRQAAPLLQAAPNWPQLVATMEGILAENLRPDPESSEAIRAYARLLGIHLVRAIRQRPPQREARLRDQLEGLRDEVDSSLAYPWSLATLAARLHYSPVQCHRLMVAHLGLRPMELVLQLRLQRAAELLRTTDYALKQIAPLVGYATPFALSRAFKRYRGLSPARYRREQGATSSEP